MSFTGSTMGKYSRLWLIITGVILLAVGGGMAVTLGNIPFAGSTMLVTGGILGVDRPGADRDRPHRGPSCRGSRAAPEPRASRERHRSWV